MSYHYITIPTVTCLWPPLPIINNALQRGIQSHPLDNEVNLRLTVTKVQRMELVPVEV